MSFTQLTFHDRLTLWLSLIGMVLMLVMAAANVYSILMSAGLAVFLNAPYLAVMMSLLAPSASLAIKFLPDALTSALSKTRYRQGLMLITALSVLLWVVLFSLNFDGMNSAIDWEGLGETQSSAKSSALVLVQLLSEILVAAVLAQKVHDISLIVEPESYAPNPAYLYTQKALNAQQAQYDALMSELQSVSVALEALRAERQTLIDDAIAQYLAARAKLAVTESGGLR